MMERKTPSDRRYESIALRDNSTAVFGDHVVHNHYTLTPSGVLAVNNDAAKPPRSDVVTTSGRLPEDELNALLSHLSNYDPLTEHWRRKDLRIQGTCTWLFENVEYQQWINTDFAVFTCTGPVGSGKSILAAAVIEHLQTISKSQVYHCFIDCGIENTAILQYVLTALIKQGLLMIRQSAPVEIQKILADIRKTRTWPESVSTLPHVINLFEHVVTLSPNAVYVIDGFDEMSESQLQEFFGIFRKFMPIFRTTGSKIALFGREIHGKGIDVSTQLINSFSVNLRSDVLAQDIERFVDVQMDVFQTRRCITQNKELLQKISMILKSKAQEMFLWIHFQFLTIWDPKLSKSDADIQELIENLPLGLIDTYKSCLKRIEFNGDRDIALTAFRWLAQAKRPLTPRELREIASFRFSDELLQESTIMNFCVTQYCANLLVVDNLGHVRFTHHSVLQLLNDASKLDINLAAYFLEPSDDSACRKLCLEYLIQQQRRQQIAVRTNLHLPPDFNSYIIEHATHAQRFLRLATTFHKRPRSRSASRVVSVPLPKSASEAELSIHAYIKEFWLQHTKQVILDDEEFERFESIYQSTSTSFWPDTPTNASRVDQKRYFLGIAVLFNHVPLLHCIKRELSQSSSTIKFSIIDDTSLGNGSSPIHIAATLGHADVVRYFLHNRIGGHKDMFDVDGKTALCYAAENAKLHTIQVIIEYEERRSRRYCRKFIPEDGVSPQYLTLSCILAALPSPWCFMELVKSGHLDLEVHSPEMQAQTMFAACRHQHYEIVSILRTFGVDMFNLHPFYYPGILYKIQGSLIAVAAREEDIEFLGFMLEHLSADDLLVLGARGDLRKVITPVMVNALLQTVGHSSVLALNPVICRGANIKPSEALDKKILICLNGSSRQHLLAILFLMNHTQSCRKYTDMLRSITPRGTAWDEIVNLSYLVRNVKIPVLISDDVLYRLCLQSWFRESFPAEFWSRSLSRGPRRDAILHAFGIARYRFFDGSITAFSLAVSNPSLMWDNLRSHLLEVTAATKLSLRLKILAAHEVILRKTEDEFRRRLTLLHLCRTVIFMFQDTLNISGPSEEDRLAAIGHMIAMLLSGSDLIFDLNFPRGYIEVRKGEWQIKPFIISALYRWNWRIRRRNGLPYSEADWRYRPTSIVCSLTASASPDTSMYGYKLYRELLHDQDKLYSHVQPNLGNVDPKLLYGHLRRRSKPRSYST